MKYFMHICIYPRTPEFHEFPPNSRDFDCGRARVSEVGTADLLLTKDTTEDLEAAFAWIKQNLSHGETSGVVCHAFVEQAHDEQTYDTAKIMHTLCEDVTETALDANTTMLTGFSRWSNTIANGRRPDRK